MADDRFYVKTLRLQNFRCFEDVELGPFDPSFNLLVGENGAGKSSVLVALAQLFFRPAPRFTWQRKYELVDNNDVRVSYFETHDGWDGPTQFFPSTINCEVQFPGTLVVVGTTISEQGINSEFPMVRPHILFDPSGVSSVLAFYRSSRKFSPAQNMDEEFPASLDARLFGYYQWFDAAQNDRYLREWLKEQTLLALQVEKRRQEGKPAEAGFRAQLQIDLLQYAVMAAIGDARGLEYDAEVADIVFRSKDGTRKRFPEMSDGQRAMIGLIADLVRRVCFINSRVLGDAALRETPGLVLIDEIDLHLHPKWQRQIVPALKKIFPKIQFFATTHSPQVIGECKPEEIVLLTPEGQKRPPASYGMDSKWILECVMEAEGRDPEIAKRIADLFNMIDDGKFDEAKAEITRLRGIIGLEPDVVAAESYIWNLEHSSDEAAE